MIKYLERYSLNDDYDKMGRWARIAYFKNIQIAWINRIEVDDKTIYSVWCHFPTLENDLAKEHKVFNSFDESKGFVEERWNWFLSEVR